MPHLSIGEVLGLLLEEFPDVTISKIRFLESQGLIDPERTPSGYRKFYDDDVELLPVHPARAARELPAAAGDQGPDRLRRDRPDGGAAPPARHPQRRRRRLRQPAVPRRRRATDDAEAVTGAAALFVRTDGERTPAPHRRSRRDARRCSIRATAPSPAAPRRRRRRRCCPGCCSTPASCAR